MSDHPEVERLAHLVGPRDGMDHARFEGHVRAWLEGARYEELAVAVAAPPRGILPLEARPFAFVVSCAPLPTSPGALDVRSYEVARSVPVEGPAEGPAMITLLRRRVGSSDAEFIGGWRGHSPLAIAVHPLVRYTRDRVVRRLDGAPPLDGIVVERVAERADLLRPWRFFGGPLSMIPNLLRVWLDARGFLDLSATENYLVEVCVEAGSSVSP